MREKKLRDEAGRVICTGTYPECKGYRAYRTLEEDGGPLYCSRVPAGDTE